MTRRAPTLLKLVGALVWPQKYSGLRNRQVKNVSMMAMRICFTKATETIPGKAKQRRLSESSHSAGGEPAPDEPDFL